MAHTKGPWAWTGNDIDQVESPYTAVLSSTVSCGQFCYGGMVDLTISDDDKRLIAAVPELLELLIELVDIEGPCPGNAGWAEKVHAAIAKATGA